MKTGCEGCEPGFCKRHKGNKSKGMVKLCQESPKHFQKWEDGKGVFVEESKDYIPLGSAIKKVSDTIGLTKVMDKVHHVTGLDCGCSGRAHDLDHAIKKGK